MPYFHPIGLNAPDFLKVRGGAWGECAPHHGQASCDQVQDEPHGQHRANPLMRPETGDPCAGYFAHPCNEIGVAIRMREVASTGS